MFHRLPFLLASLALLSFSGCVHYSPFEVKRWWADWNTEEECNAQVEVFDHLPPKPVRVRLMRWGYNIGPAGAMTSMSSIGPGTQVCPPGADGGPGAWPELPPQAAPPNPARQELIPVPPPAPPAELPLPDGELGPGRQPSASRDPVITGISYQRPTVGRNRRAAKPPANPAWLFAR